MKQLTEQDMIKALEGLCKQIGVKAFYAIKKITV